MLDLKEIDINDKELFDSYIKKSGLKASEYNFTNFFMWRKFYKARYTIINDLLCVISHQEKAKPFVFMPLGRIVKDNLKITISELNSYFRESGWKLCFSRVEEDALRCFKDISDYNFEYLLDRDNCDYVYSTTELIELSGKKFNKKRNHLNAFLKDTEFGYCTMDGSHIDDCIRIMQEWCDKRECRCIRGEYCERHANTEVLENFNKLSVTGALISIDNKFEAFTIGEKFTEDTAVVHIEKANESIRGLYNIINREFVKNEFFDTVYINREQDLGQLGLRKSKLSYQPISLLNKYNIYL